MSSQYLQSNQFALGGILQQRMPVKVKVLTVPLLLPSLILVSLHLLRACSMPSVVLGVSSQISPGLSLLGT